MLQETKMLSIFSFSIFSMTIKQLNYIEHFPFIFLSAFIHIVWHQTRFEKICLFKESSCGFTETHSQLFSSISARNCFLKKDNLKNKLQNWKWNFHLQINVLKLCFIRGWILKQRGFWTTKMTSNFYLLFDFNLNCKSHHQINARCGPSISHETSIF